MVVVKQMREKLYKTYSQLKTMGNRNNKIGNDDKSKWCKENTKLQVIQSTVSKQMMIDCRPINDTEVLVATLCGSYLYITKLDLLINKKNKVYCKSTELQLVDLRGAATFACAISPSLEYIACGGMRNQIDLYRKAKDQYSYEFHTELWGAHEAYIAVIKFVSDNLVLSGSGDASVVLWDVKTQAALKQIQCAKYDVLGLDYLYLHGRHIIAFGSMDDNVYIRDITSMVDETKSDKEREFTISQQALGQFKSDVNAVVFSPNGQYLAATSDDASYEVYVQTIKYDLSLNSKVVEWELLFKKYFGVKSESWDNDYNGVSITWADDKTLMVGIAKGNVLYCTHIDKQSEDKNVINALNDAIENIIKSLGDMDWIGFCSTISNEILRFIDHRTTYDFQYNFLKDEAYRVSGIANCEWNNNGENKHLVVFSCWDKKSRAIILQ